MSMTLSTQAFLFPPPYKLAPQKCIFSIAVGNRDGMALIEIPVSDATQDKTYLSWTLAHDMELVDLKTHKVIAKLVAGTDEHNMGRIRNDANHGPRVEFAYNLLAGNSDTQVIVRSNFCEFPAMVNPEARSSGTACAGDMNDDGARVHAVGAPGTSIFLNQYNFPVPTGVLFAGFLNNIEMGAGGYACGNQRMPPFGYQVITDTVKAIGIQGRFVVTAKDHASGTDYFEIAVS